MADNLTIMGFNTGLDLKLMINKMLEAERAPKQFQLDRLEVATKAKSNGISQLKNAIFDLQTVLKELNKAELFRKRTATSSDAKLVTATATKDALPGNYRLKVEQLATSSKVVTASLGKDYKTAVGGTLTVKLGPDDVGVGISVAAGASLSEVRDSLNAQLKDKGITASIVHNPVNGNSRLMLSAKDTGAGKDIFVQASAGLEAFNIGSVGADGKLTIDALDSSNTASSGYITQAQNARFSIDGLQLESTTNKVDKVIDGVTFELQSETKDKSVTIAIEQDRTGVKDNIKKFVDAYNKLMDVTSSLTKVASSDDDDERPVSGALLGDSLVRNLLTTMRNELIQPGNGDLRILADMGVSTDKVGKLVVDEKKLDKALEGNFEAVAKLFTGDDGLMKRLDSKLANYTQAGGLLDQRRNGLASTMKSVGSQRKALDHRIEQLRARLVRQFTAMDNLIGRLTQTSGRLEQALGSLPGLVKK